MFEKSQKIILLIVIGPLVFGLVLYFVLRKPEPAIVEPPPGTSCETKSEQFTMAEDVMSDFIKQNENVEVIRGYYNCKEVERDDIVLVQTSGRTEPVIRIIKVLPGDEFKLDKKQQSYVLKVNGATMESLEGSPYTFNEQKSRLLQLYEKSLKGKMSDNIYFVFSNKLDGGYDSTRFGPVEKAKILGKVIKK